MFEKFGEFDSWEEINRAAAAQKEEGDTEAILALAKENGLDEEDAQAYIDGDEDELTTITLAMYGKLDLETKEYEVEGPMRDWISELKDHAKENEPLALAIRKKGKSVTKWIAKCIDESEKHHFVVNKEITKNCSKEVQKHTQNHPLIMGGITRKQMLEIATKYYLQNDEKPHKDSEGGTVGGEA